MLTGKFHVAQIKILMVYRGVDVSGGKIMRYIDGQRALQMLARANNEFITSELSQVGENILRKST